MYVLKGMKGEVSTVQRDVRFMLACILTKKAAKRVKVREVKKDNVK